MSDETTEQTTAPEAPVETPTETVTPETPAEPTEAPAEPAPEGQNDRVNAFISEYGELVRKHKIDFASYPTYVPDGQGGFKTVIQNTPVDVTDVPVKSPFIPQS